MSVFYLVLPLALLLVFVAVLAFVWAARRGQFDDLDTPALRIVPDDEAPPGGLPAARSRNSPDEPRALSPTALDAAAAQLPPNAAEAGPP